MRFVGGNHFIASLRERTYESRENLSFCNTHVESDSPVKTGLQARSTYGRLFGISRAAARVNNTGAMSLEPAPMSPGCRAACAAALDLEGPFVYDNY